MIDLRIVALVALLSGCSTVCPVYVGTVEVAAFTAAVVTGEEALIEVAAGIVAMPCYRGE